MKLNLTKRFLPLTLLVTLSFGMVAATSPNLGIIRQVEQLLETISPKDKIQRRALTVKLANLHYAEALRISAEEDITDSANQRSLERHQKAAAQYYEKFVTGDGGKFDAPYGEQLETARLQLSHMYSDIGRLDDAQKIWKDLLDKDEYPAIMSEAALSMAEVYEGEDAASDKALKLYEKVAETNKKFDTIQYANYRSAWILRNQAEFEDAIKMLKKCVYDSNGVAKEEVINDMIVFYSLSAIDASKAYADIREFSEKLQKPDLLKQLADAYIAAGNKIAAVDILKKVTIANSNSIHSIRLLEESYGLRDWDTFDATLDRIAQTTAKAKDEKYMKEAHVVLRRLAIQLDAERVTNKDLTPKFTAVVDLFAELYPQDEIVEKMVSGAVLAETDNGSKIKRINAILGNPGLAVSAKQRLVLREQLVHLYQDAGEHDKAATESSVLVSKSTDDKDKRRFKFVQASELYDQQKEDQALPLFKQLVAENSIDDIGRKSQLLATRYLGRSKRYDEALALTTPWLARAKDDKASAGSNEYQEIAELHEKIVFENAVDQGAEAKSLATFMAYCQEGKFLPTSCTNAESLAVKLKRYDDLLVLLRKADRKDDILAVLESTGRFAPLAEMLEKSLDTSSDLKKILKVALFWEMSGSFADRDRVLGTLQKAVIKQGFHSEAEESLVFNTLFDAGMLNKNSLALKWNDTNRCYILNELMVNGDHSKQLEQSILSCPTSPGKAWDDIVFAKVDALDKAQRKITFYGNGSKRKFEHRIKAINAMLKVVDQYMPAANHDGYVKLGEIGANALNDFAIEIETTPLPDEATEEMIPQITAALAEMAHPFHEKSNGYQDLVAGENKKFAEAAQTAAAKQPLVRPTSFSKADVEPQLTRMMNDPDNMQALNGLLSVYQSHGQKRPAAYIEGRLSVASQGGSKSASH